MTSPPAARPVTPREGLPREEFAVVQGRSMVLGWSVLDTRDADRDTSAQAGALADLYGRRAIFLKQVHGTHCVVLRSGEAVPDAPAQADGILTDRSDVLAGVSAADCLPLFLIADGAWAVLHAGWRGVLGGILPLAVARLKQHFGVQPPDLKLFIGPGIGACCFEVSAAVWILFPAAHRRQDQGRLKLDLEGVVDEQWRRCGAREPANRLGRCTVCSQPRLHSFRRDGGGGRNFAYACVC